MLGLLQILIFKSKNTHLKMAKYSKMSKILKNTQNTQKTIKIRKNPQFNNPKYGYFDDCSIFCLVKGFVIMVKWLVLTLFCA